MNRNVVIGLLLIGVSRGHADDPRRSTSERAAPTTDAPDETIVIIDRAPDRETDPTTRDRDRLLGDAPFVTIVRAGDHAATNHIGSSPCWLAAARAARGDRSGRNGVAPGGFAKRRRNGWPAKPRRRKGHRVGDDVTLKYSLRTFREARFIQLPSHLD